MRVFLPIVAALAVIASPAAAELTLSNAPHATQQSIAPFGPLSSSATPTYGQVFALPASGTLTSFSFTLTGGVGQIFAGLGTWTGDYNYGPAGGSPTTLWQSAYISTSPTQTTYTFTPNVPVLSLTKYVAYISVFGSPDASGSTELVLGKNAESWFRYFTFDNGADSPNGSTAWTNYSLDVGDALFSVTVGDPVFAPGIPEPAAWALMIGGFGMVGAVARRRRSGLALAA